MQDVATNKLKHQKELESRRQAIMVGLSPYMTLDENLAAIKIWEARYRDTPKFALHNFVREVISNDSQLWEFRNNIFTNIIKMLVMDAKQIEQQYQEIFTAQNNMNDVSMEFINQSHRTVFKRLYITYLQIVEKNDLHTAISIRKFIHEKLLQKYDFTTERHKLNSWLLGISKKLGYDISLDECKEIIHLTYVASCEYIGPVQTDRTMAKAVNMVEQLGDYNGFSVRDLL